LTWLKKSPLPPLVFVNKEEQRITLSNQSLGVGRMVYKEKTSEKSIRQREKAIRNETKQKMLAKLMAQQKLQAQHQFNQPQHQPQHQFNRLLLR
jgi:hypothetical protein